MTQVAAAVIRNEDGQILICQRPLHKGNPLLWEFPGGKLEPGETLQQCLIRECREELNVDIVSGPVLAETTHTYPDITVHLTFFDARIASGSIVQKEHADMRWVTPEDMLTFPFCPADIPLLATLAGLE